MKTSVSLRAPRLVAILALAFATLSVSNLSAQTTVKTIPVGVVNLTIGAAPSPSVPNFVALSLPLVDGIVFKGTISAVGASTITVSNTVAQTFNATNPYLLRITSGSHAGRSFVILSNVGNVLTVDTEGTPLNALSPALNLGASGDSFQIAVADTIAGVFGTQTLGSANPNNADQVWLWASGAGTFVKFFYNSGTSQWEDLDNEPAGSTVIRPDSGIFFVRRGLTPLTLSLTGEVPTTDIRVRVKESGFSFASGALPVDTTLLGTGLHNQAAWVKGATAAASDQVWVWASGSGSFVRFYYSTAANGWLDLDDESADATVIASGTPVFIKKAAVSGSNLVTTVFPLPASYNIN
jgi:uncharacterized protein (TIGR02597 family)